MSSVVVQQKTTTVVPNIEGAKPIKVVTQAGTTVKVTPTPGISVVAAAKQGPVGPPGPRSSGAYVLPDGSDVVLSTGSDVQVTDDDVLFEGDTSLVDFILTHAGNGTDQTARDLANAAGTLAGTKYLKPNTGIPESDLSTGVQTKLNAVVTGGGYVKPSGGIPEADLAAAVTAKLSPSTAGPVVGRVDVMTAARVPIVDTDTYINAVLTITKVPGVADLTTSFRIRGRGHYSFTNSPKKPYKVKLDNTLSLAGMPAHKDWALLSNWHDETLLNYPMGLSLGYLASGLLWTPRFVFVELWLNGDYKGLYMLTESSEYGASRVNATKASGTTGLSTTGAYSFEVTRYLEAGEVGFATPSVPNIVFQDPDGTNATLEAIGEAQVRDLEARMFSSNWQDPTLGYRAVIDPNSWADWYIVNELGGAHESDFGSSCKFYRTRDTAQTPGRFFWGPIWDWDHAFGKGTPSHSPTAFLTRNGPWFGRLMQDPWFLNLVGTRYNLLLAALNAANGGADAFVDVMVQRIAAARERDGVKWTYSPDFAADAALKKSWFAIRMPWLLNAIGADRSVVGTNIGSTI